MATWLVHSTPEREVRVQALTGEQGCRSGESSCPPPLWFGFDSRTRRHVWVEFVVGSHPCSEGFPPGSLVFLPPQKSTHLNSNSISKQWKKSHFMEMSLQIPIYFIIFILFRSVMRHSWPSSTNIVSGIHTLRAERARSSCQTLPCHTTVSD